MLTHLASSEAMAVQIRPIRTKLWQDQPQQTQKGNR